VTGKGDRRPADLSREIYDTWISGQLEPLQDLVCEDVTVSGYLTDGRPLQGKEAVLAMVASFSHADGIELVDVEELNMVTALLQMRLRVDPTGDPQTMESFWLWTFRDGMLDESHAFLSRDAALLWFGEAGPTR
jgi:ketosteroid isomerase-like protein